MTVILSIFWSSIVPCVDDSRKAKKSYEVY